MSSITVRSPWINPQYNVNNLLTLEQIRLVLLQFSSKLLKFFLLKADIKRHFLKLLPIYMLPKVMIRKKRTWFFQIFHQQKFQQVLMKIDKMADFFLNSANFAQHALLTLVPPSGYTFQPKALIKVTKVSWTSQLSYKILWSLFERKSRKDKLHFSQKTPCKSPGSNRVKWYFW